MRITAIRDLVVPIRSDIRNAFIDFSQMTASIVGIQSDVIRDGAPLIGYGFNSNGRYSQSGILRDRFIPRLLEAEPDALLNDAGDNLDPARAWDIMLANEKPGGHGERSVAVGVLDMALWDLVAKIEGCLSISCSGSALAAANTMKTCLSMPPAATTIRARTLPRCKTRSRPIATWAISTSRSKSAANRWMTIGGGLKRSLIWSATGRRWRSTPMAA